MIIPRQSAVPLESHNAMRNLDRVFSLSLVPAEVYTLAAPAPAFHSTSGLVSYVLEPRQSGERRTGLDVWSVRR
jgi:hypothetical protein